MSKADARKAAKTLSNLGAVKGGHARAAKLTKEQRSAIARKASLARWAKTYLEEDLSYAERDAADR